MKITLDNGVKMKKKINQAKEKNVHQQVCDWLKLQWPKIIFTSDPSGMRVSMGLRMELKRKRCAGYVIPDLIILEPRGIYHGLMLEIKRDRSEIFYKSGGMKLDNDRIAEQFKTLVRLRELGYAAHFGCGFENCQEIINRYLHP